MDYIEIIKNHRIDNDIKQYEISKILNINPKSYSMYENRDRKIPIDKLDLILITFNISLDYVLGLTKNKKYEKMKKIDFKKYTENIKIIRLDKGLKQIEMAKKIGCSQQTLSSYENNKLIMPLETLKKLCKEFNVSSDYITGRIDYNIKLNNKK